LDAETTRTVLARYFEAMRTALGRYGAVVEKFIGDAVMAIFGLPRVHEDDALRAVLAALDMKRELQDVNHELEARWGVTLSNRTGISTGEVVVGDSASAERLATGDAVNVAARLQQSAAAGEILMGESTYRLVRDAVAVEQLHGLNLKGKTQGTRVYRVIGADDNRFGVARRLDTPLVGREAEMSLVQQAFERVLQRRSCALVNVVGEAGIGKSRFVKAITASLEGRATTLQGYCLPYGEGITFWPVAEILRQSAMIGLDDSSGDAVVKLRSSFGGPEGKSIVERLGALIGGPSRAFRLEEVYWAVRKAIERLAGNKPLAVIFEDIHWGETTFLDLIGYLADSLSASPVVVICTARREFLEDIPEWARDRDEVRMIELGALSEPQVEELIDNFLGGLKILPEVRAAIVRLAQGNPLFVEQLISVGMEDGTLFNSPKELLRRSDPSPGAIPTTLTGVLTARLDRLSREERSVIGSAAIIGDTFSSDAVRHLCPGELRSHVGESLKTLVGKEFIRPLRGEHAEQQSFVFRHLLIRDSAYQGLLKRTRAELHEKFAVWLEARAKDRITEFEEIVGFHIEQAVRYRQEIAPLDEVNRSLALRAGRLLASAGRRAVSRGDARSSVNLLQRARALLNAELESLELLPNLGHALWNTGRLEDAAAVLHEAVTCGEPKVEARAVVLRAMAGVTSIAESLEEVKTTIPLFRRLADTEGLASALHMIGTLMWWQGKLVESEQALGQALVLERRIGRRDTMFPSVVMLAVVLTEGPTPVNDCLRRLQVFLDYDPADTFVNAFLLGNVAMLTAMQGAFDHARALLGQSREMLKDLGFYVHEVASAQFSGNIEMLAGEPLRAETELRRGYEGLLALGEKSFLSTTSAQLAEALYELGRLDEAIIFTDIAKKSIDDDEDVVTQILWRRVRALVLAQQGELSLAEALARSSVEIAARTQYVREHGAALMSLGKVLDLCNKRGAAKSARLKALRLYEEKGNLVSAEAARRALKGHSGYRIRS
jgi:class 3 adenylate cyclase/tetratricopeptide (TPR) repeat protein